MLLLLLQIATAQAGEIENWEKLHDALLVQTADGDLDRAIALYQQLARNLPPSEDPLRAETLYWLGRAQYDKGDSAAAGEALKECIRILSPSRVRCREQLAAIELELASIVRVPTHWTFDGRDHGVTHPLYYEDKGSLRIDPQAPGGDPALQWTTFVDRSKDDVVVIGFRRPSPPPETIRFVLRSTAFDARIRVILYDVYGRKYATSAFAVVIPTERWAEVEIDVASATSDDALAEPLNPSLLDRLVIQDVTAFGSRQRSGENVLHLDDFEVR